MPKSYPPELRRRVVELCRTGAQPSRVAADLGLSEATVYRWIAQDEVDTGKRAGTHSSESIELSRARSRIRELEAELELTRKASALFSEGEERPTPKWPTR